MRDRASWHGATVLVIIGTVIRTFADAATEDLLNGLDSRRARRACPATLWPAVTRKLAYWPPLRTDSRITPAALTSCETPINAATTHGARHSGASRQGAKNDPR